MAIIDPKTGVPIRSSGDEDRLGRWFSAYLASRGVVVNSASAFGVALLQLDAYSAWNRQERPIEAAKLFATLRGAHSAEYLIRALNQVLPGYEDTLRPHLETFRGPDVSLMGPGRNTPERHRTWEILAGSIFAKIVGNATLSEPEDVRFEYQGDPWGASCKMIFTRNAGSQRDRIVEGAKQLEASSVRYGFVVVNLTPIIDHDALLATNTQDVKQWRSPVPPTGLLAAEIRRIVAGIVNERLKRRLRATASGQARDKARGVLFFAQTVVFIGATPTTLSQATFWRDFRRVEGPETELFTRWAAGAGSVLDAAFENHR